MNRRKSGLKFALLASTALSAFAIFSTPETALAACNAANPANTINTGAGGNLVFADGGILASNLIAPSNGGSVTYNGTQTALNDCLLRVGTDVDPNGVTFNVAGTIETTDDRGFRFTGDVDNTSFTIDIAGSLTAAVSAIDHEGDGTLNVNVTGTVNGRIRFGFGNDVMVLDGGTMTGDILTRAGNDQVTLTNGAILNGNIDLAANTDTLTLVSGVTVNGNITGAGGTDTIIFDGANNASWNMNAITNFEILTKEGSGEVELTGNSDADLTTVNVNGGVLSIGAGANISPSGVTNINAGTLQVAAGGTYVAGSGILGGINLDTIVVSGNLTTNGADLGGQDDFLVLNTGGVITGGVDAGANGGQGDFFFLSGTGVDSFNLSNVGAGQQFENFENLVKTEAGTWALTGTGSFETLLVAGGVLRLQAGAVLNVTSAASTTVNAGLYLVLGTHNEAGTTTVAGGVLRVDGAGDYNANGNVLVSGGVLDIDGGTFDAALLTTVTFGTLAVQGGTYTAVGLTTVDGGVLRVDSGTYTAQVNSLLLSGTILINGGNFNENLNISVLGGTLRVNGGTATTTGLTFVDGGVLRVDTGTYQANGDTTVQSGTLVVFGGNYFGGNDVGDATTVSGGLLRVAGGTFTAAGLTTVNGGTLQVDSGTYNANGVVNVLSGLLDLNAGSINAAAAVTVTGGTLAVQGGTFNANLVTVVGGTGVLRVDSGIFNSNGVTNGNGNGIILVNGGTFNANAATVMVANSQLRVFGAGVYDATGFAINLAATATVLGTGTIIGTLNNDQGAVSPGALPGLGQVGTLFLTGTYNQLVGGTGNFQADVQPGGPADRLAITGDAALGGNVQINTLAANFGALEQFRIISTQNPIPTIFETATVTGAGAGTNIVWIGRVDDAGVFNEADPATGNNVDVIITTAPDALEGLTPNQQAVADYLGTFAVAGGVFIEDPTAFLITQIVAGGPNALDQIGGEVYDSFTAFSFNIARQFGGLVDTRVRTLRCASAKGPSAPFCNSGQTLLADAGPGLAPGAPGTTSPNGFSPNTHPYGWSVWAQAIGSYVSKDRTTNNLGYSGWTGGGAIGVDLALSQRWIVGVLAGGTRSNIDFSGVSGDGDLEAVTVGVYTAWYGSRWFANAAFTYTKTWVEADRDLQFGSVNSTAKGKTEGDQYAIHSTVGYGFKIRKISLEATGGVDWVQLRQYGFTETGAGGLNLSVRSRTDDSLRLRFGIRAARAWKVRPNLIIAPSIRVGYAREILDNTRGITSSLVGIGGSFTVNGDEGSRNILTYGGGVQAVFSQGITLYLRHSGEWAGDRTSHTFNGGIKVTW